ncbi:C40 family peptidase [Brevibacterium atlanticum]|uniref:C40 family peptidase n=1 Tax=Brevibacterium atlanticum TaxID=2697563 RepID=UPI001423CFB0|nr:C40 family peptidase [Brevibacterium atlanticum]
MATKQHGRRAADAKVKTPLTELTELLNANSGVFGRRAAVVAASGGLLTAAVMPAAGQGADDQNEVSAQAETTQQVDFENQSVTIGDDSKDKKGEKKADSLESQATSITADAAPKPKPKPTPTQTATADSDESAGTSDDTANSGSSDSGKSDSDDAGSIDGSKAEQVLAWAEKGVGTPYVMGGTSQSGWDCSGYTSWVFSHVGVNLPRTSGAQKGAGQIVSQSEAKPGDLVWHPGHVGIYAGGGQMYDAGSPSSGTSKRSYSWMGNVTFIRVL